VVQDCLGWNCGLGNDVRCTLCSRDLAFPAGENQEDWWCSNKACYQYNLRYYTNVKVREGWWFSPGYCLPFWCNGGWFCAYGPVDDKTMFQALYPPIISSSPLGTIFTIENARQEFLFAIPYYALPVNDDFNAQFDILKSKFEHHKTRPLPTRFSNLLLDD
jgi:hypothetical protein